MATYRLDDEDGNYEDDEVWVQCNLCNKWRALPNSVDLGEIPEVWTCSMNAYDLSLNTCDAPEKLYRKGCAASADVLKRTKENKEEIADIYGEYFSAEELATIKKFDQLEVLCADGLNYYVRVLDINHETNRINLHFPHWGSRHDYKGKFTDLFLTTRGKYSDGLMKNNHYADDDDDYVYDGEEQERPRAQSAPIQPVQPAQTRQPSKNGRSKQSQFPTGTVYPEGFLSKPKNPNKRSFPESEKNGGDDDRHKTTTKKLKSTPRLIPPAPQRLQVGSSYRNDLVRALDDVTEQSESEDDSEDSNDEYFDTNSMNEWREIDSKSCNICDSKKNESKLLLCDGCDDQYHMYCLVPEITAVPRGDWFCYKCVDTSREKIAPKKRDPTFCFRRKRGRERGRGILFTHHKSHSSSEKATAKRVPLTKKKTPVTTKKAPVLETRAPVIEQRAPVIKHRVPLIVQRVPVSETSKPRDDGGKNPTSTCPHCSKVFKPHTKKMCISSHIESCKGAQVDSVKPRDDSRAPVIEQRAPVIEHRVPLIVQRAPVIEQRAPVSDTTASATSHESIAITSTENVLESAWKILNDDVSSLNANRPKLTKMINNLGLSEPADLKFLEDDEINELVELLKPVKGRRFAIMLTTTAH